MFWAINQPNWNSPHHTGQNVNELATYAQGVFDH